MESYEMKRIAREALEQHITDKTCPKCKAETTFLRVSVWPEDDSPCLEKWRCLNCLTLFTEELKEES